LHEMICIYGGVQMNFSAINVLNTLHYIVFLLKCRVLYTLI
jgi:hypothetical protein